ncbi:Protein cms1 [Coemansia sp. RSA 1285]|nr:Protein cms1 [Coemansia sp. RSA 1285]
MPLKNDLADALEDDFALDDDFAVADSASASDYDDDTGAGASTGKRRRTQLEASDTEDTEAANKKQKQKQKKKNSSKKQSGGSNDPSTATTAGSFRTLKKFSVPTELDEQAALWNRCMKKAYPGIAQLELADIGMQEKHMYRHEANQKTAAPTTSGHAEPSYLEELVGSVVAGTNAKNKITYGAPQVLVICSSALRVVDLVRRLRPLTGRTVLKLFSKHVKIAAHKKTLNSSPTDIAVGTPNRIHKLLADGDLKPSRLRLVVIDCWQDEKMRVVVDMDDTRADLFAIWRDILLPASANPDYTFKFRLV